MCICKTIQNEPANTLGIKCDCGKLYIWNSNYNKWSIHKEILSDIGSRIKLKSVKMKKKVIHNVQHILTVIEMYRNGQSERTISESTGLTRHAIVRILSENNVEKRDKKQARALRCLPK